MGGTAMRKVSIEDEFGRIDEAWSPLVVAELNGQQVKLAFFRGEFEWHAHETEDELFFVVSGRVRIELEEEAVELTEGELFVVPSGVRHRPVAEPEARVLLFEPASTRRMGNAD